MGHLKFVSELNFRTKPRHRFSWIQRPQTASAKARLSAKQPHGDLVLTNEAKVRRHTHKLTGFTRSAGLTYTMDNSKHRWDTTYRILLTQPINKISLSVVFSISTYKFGQEPVGINKLIPTLDIYGASFSETVPIDVDSVLRVQLQHQLFMQRRRCRILICFFTLILIRIAG